MNRDLFAFIIACIFVIPYFIWRHFYLKRYNRRQNAGWWELKKFGGWI